MYMYVTVTVHDLYMYANDKKLPVHIMDPSQVYKAMGLQQFQLSSQPPHLQDLKRQVVDP